MNTTAYLGPVTAQFRTNNNAILEIYKVSNYQKKIPEEFEPEDCYLVIGEAEKAFVSLTVPEHLMQSVQYISMGEVFFYPEVNPVIPDKLELDDGVNEITIIANDIMYYFAVHIVRTGDVAHEESSGIDWCEGSQTYYFVPLGIFGTVLSLFTTNSVYNDDGQPITVKGEDCHDIEGCCVDEELEEVSQASCCGGGKCCGEEPPVEPVVKQATFNVVANNFSTKELDTLTGSDESKSQ